ncbi:hypothetical protein AMELA_G00043750, partial [Ameiurus melas]
MSLDWGRKPENPDVRDSSDRSSDPHLADTDRRTAGQTQGCSGMPKTPYDAVYSPSRIFRNR